MQLSLLPLSLLLRRKDKENPTIKVTRIVNELKTQSETYRSLEAIEELAATARNLLNLTAYERPLGEDMIDDACRNAHRFSFGMIFNELTSWMGGTPHTPHKKTYSLDDIASLETKADQHLIITGISVEEDSPVVRGMKDIFIRALHCVCADLICEELNAITKPITCEEIDAKERAFQANCSEARLPLAKKADYDEKFKKVAEKARRFSAKELLDLLETEGNFTYLLHVYRMAVDIYCHSKALGPDVLDKNRGEIKKWVKHAKTGNTAGPRPIPPDKVDDKSSPGGGPA